MQEQPPEQQELSHSMQFFIGLGVGLIPLVVALISIGLISSGGISLFFFAVILYVVELVVTFVMLSIKRLRFVGYALLAMFLITPVVFFIACFVRPGPIL